MKKSLLFFIAICFIHLINYSQTPWTYFECSSGVSSNLTGASTLSYIYPTHVLVCGTGGVVLKSTNNGVSWQNMSGGGLPANIDLKCISYISYDTAVTAGNTGSATFIYRTINGGLNWTQVFSQSNGSINAIVFKNSQLGFALGNPVAGRWSLWKTTNKGLSWDSTGLFIPQNGSETGYPNCLALRHNYIFFGTNNSRIYRSSNTGLNWSYVNALQINTTSIWINQDTSGYPPPGYAFIYSGGTKLYKSTSIGSVWSQVTFPDSISNFVGYCPGIPGVDNIPFFVFAAKNNGKIYFSNYGGSAFTEKYTAPSGIYNYMTVDVLGSGYSFAVRNNGGITRIDHFLGGGINQLSSLIPDNYSLYQNYPNPFNPITYLQFAVKHYGLIKLSVFDVNGREIYIPVNELLKPGLYEVSWDASSFASGIYFYRLQTDGYISTKKMILIK